MNFVYWLGLGLGLGLNLLSCHKKASDANQASLKALNPAQNQASPSGAVQAPIDPTHAGLALVPHESGEVRTPYQPSPKEQLKLEALAAESKNFLHLKGEQTKALATYKKYCASCHGEAGRGDGPDGDKLPVAPTNFHEWNIKYGRTPELIALTTLSGRNDEVMPAYQGVLSTEQLWSVVYLVASWIEARPDHK